MLPGSYGLLSLLHRKISRNKSISGGKLILVHTSIEFVVTVGCSKGELETYFTRCSFSWPVSLGFVALRSSTILSNILGPIYVPFILTEFHQARTTFLR